MEITWLLGLAGFAFAMAGTPGPNNTMATATGLAHGMRRAVPFLGGVAFGVAAITLAVALFGASLAADPWIAGTLKWIGVAYLLWLAWKIGSTPPKAIAAGERREPAHRPPGFAQGALLQFVNPKLWMMAGGAIVAYGHPGAALTPWALATLFALLLGGITLACASAWAALGALIGQWQPSPRALRAFNLVMAAMLVLSLLPIVMA